MHFYACIELFEDMRYIYCRLNFSRKEEIAKRVRVQIERSLAADTCQEKQTLEEQSRAANEVLFKKKKAQQIWLIGGFPVVCSENTYQCMVSCFSMTSCTTTSLLCCMKCIVWKQMVIHGAMRTFDPSLFSFFPIEHSRTGVPKKKPLRFLRTATRHACFVDCTLGLEMKVLAERSWHRLSRRCGCTVGKAVENTGFKH